MDPGMGFAPISLSTRGYKPRNLLLVIPRTEIKSYKNKRNSVVSKFFTLLYHLSYYPDENRVDWTRTNNTRHPKHDFEVTVPICFIALLRMGRLELP